MVQNHFLGDNDDTPREIDLSKPPVVPYRHQDYPKMLYGPNETWTKVSSKTEEAKAIKAGWSLKPTVKAAPPVEKVAPNGFVADLDDIPEENEQKGDIQE